MLFKIFTVLLVFCCVAQATDGAAFSGHGPKQEGTAGAGVAKPQDSTWINLNPAGITELMNSLDLSYEYLRPNRKTKMRGGFPSNSMDDQDTGKSLIPNLSMVYEIDKDSRFGLGLFTVTGVNNHMSSSRSFLGDAGNYDKNVDYYSLKLNAVYATKLSNGWSVGFGPTVIFSRMRSDMGNASGTEQTTGNNEWDDSWGAGFIVGVYKKWDWIAFGATYSSRQWTETFHSYDDIILTPLDHPQYIQAGFAFTLADGLDWLIDYKWIDWDSISQFGRPGSKAGFGFRDSHVIKTGIVWEATEDLTLRCGYSYGKSPINGSDQYANALFPSVTEHHASIGASYRVNENWEVSLSWLRAFKNGIKEDGKDLGGIGQGSTSSLELDFIALGFTWNF